MKKFPVIILCLVSVFRVSAQLQDDSTALSFSSYAEIYYQYDLSNPDNHTAPSFIYSHNRSKEVNLNLGYIKASYNAKKLRAALSLAAGTYMNANLAAEPGVLQNIYEANAGIKISSQKNLWIDAGIFASHIGFESAISKDCPTLTRSLLAENSPYYEAGIKIGYTSDNGKWFLSALVLNGWQHIQRPDGNHTPAFGTQVTYKPNNKITINSSTFIGNDKPDTARRMRYFHDLYAMLQLSETLSITAAFDAGMEQQMKGSNKMNMWYSPALIMKINTSQKTALAFRGEYYNDKNGVIVPAINNAACEVLGFSANFDITINKHATWRIEAKTLNSSNKIFERNDKPVNSNAFITTSLAVSF